MDKQELSEKLEAAVSNIASQRTGVQSMTHYKNKTMQGFFSPGGWAIPQRSKKRNNTRALDHRSMAAALLESQEPT